jgi:MFS family permease
MSQAWELLRGNSRFRAYWSARLLSLGGDQVAMVALLLIAFRRGGNNGLAVSALLLAMTIPFFFGPLTGAVSDRFDPRRLMIVCDIGQTVLFAVLALVPLPFPAVVVVVGLASVFAALFQPAGRGRLPVLVSREQLQTANGLLGLGLNGGRAAGPLIGGLLVAAVGPERTLLVDAASFAASAVLLRALPVRLRGSGPGDVDLTYLARLRAGLETLLRTRVALVLTGVMFLTVAFASLDNVALVFLASDTLHGNSVLFGLLTSVYGLGMALGPGLLLPIAGRVSSFVVMLAGFTLNGAGNVVTGLAPSAIPALAGQGVAGIGNGLELVGADTAIQERVPEDNLGTVFGTVYTAPLVATSLSYLAGGPLVNAVGPRAVFVLSGAGIIAVVACVPIVLGSRTWLWRATPAAPGAQEVDHPT